jgi:hypothetical protein
VTPAAPSEADAVFLSSFELSYGGIDGGEERPVADRIGDGLDVGTERAIVA